ncbi:MAG: nucleoside hydrolase [Chloroflexi bacterium]|nr:nucleoside hydrolase [Chloroflexota bacterium]
MARRNVVIDCDTGVDDALALLLALRSPAFNVLGITTVAGNVPLDKVLRNTLIVVEHSGKQVPVYHGSPRPLLSPLHTAEIAHGSDGLGDIGFPDPQSSFCKEHAVDFLIRTFMEAKEPVELITLAPLTNVALALLKEPRLEERISTLWMMAGGITGGNATAAAEFNIFVDPEAADIVFRSRIPTKTMVPLEPIAQGAKIYPEDAEKLESSPSPWCWLAGKLLNWEFGRWRGPISPCDLAAVAVVVDQTIAESKLYSVVIETRGEHTRGMTVVDRREWRTREIFEPNVNVVTAIDSSKFHRLVMDTFLAS